MAYPYFNGVYQPAYQPPMMDNLGQLRQQQYPQGGQSMLWVSGQAEAMAYPVAPNSAVALWDTTAQVVYKKQADASGRPIMQVFELVERNSAQQAAPAAPAVEYVTVSQFEALVARVDALSKEADDE